MKVDDDEGFGLLLLIKQRETSFFFFAKSFVLQVGLELLLLCLFAATLSLSL